MSYLRHISTRRLLALLAATVVVLAGSAAAIALAAGGSGPTPPPKPLAQAVHDALAAPAVDGVTARITFTNHLVDAASLQGGDPLLTGAKGRLWATGHKLRLELQASSADGRAGDVQVLLNGDRLTVIETATNTVFRAKLPQDKQTGSEPVPSLARIQSVLAHLAERATLSDAQPSDVAGRPAYTVRISPRHDGGLLGGAEVAWDAEHGVPLRAAVYANGAADPVLELKATDIAFGKVAAGDLAIPEPAGAHVVDLNPSAAGAGADQQQADVTGLQAVQAKVGFTIVAPDALVGLPRKEVKLVELDGAPAALVTYGEGLGGIAVFESPSKAQPPTQQKGGGDGGGLSLPKISINGTSGQELDSALGTVVRFDRGGVGFVVAGSVPPTAAEAAARGL
jgi:outer membrane lipoprotein-sorting protein